MSKMSHDIFKEQRIFIKLLVKLRKNGRRNRAYVKQLCNEVTMKKLAIYDWIQRFRDGQEDVNDDPGCSRHIETRTPSNVERVKQLLDSDRHLSIRDAADELSTVFYSVTLKIPSGHRFQSVEDIQKIRLLHLKALRKKSSVHASGNGNSAWRSAFSPGSAILRMINFLTLWLKYILINKFFPDN